MGFGGREFATPKENFPGPLLRKLIGPMTFETFSRGY